MRKYERGQLHSGVKKRAVTSRQQAIAISLSKCGVSQRSTSVRRRHT